MSLRHLSIFVTLLLLVAACGTAETAAPSVTTAPAPVATEAPTATDAPTTQAPATTNGTEATPSTSEATEPSPSGVDGPAAPDFTLALGDGSSYQLSADTKPVYMIFWAEW